MKKAVPILAVALVLWAVLAFGEKAFLLKNGDLSLFILDWSFLKSSLLIPGGFLGWVGSFFTQFLLVPWAGALLWVAMLTAAGILTVRVFKIPYQLAPVAAISVALLIIGNMSLGYGIYVMRDQDHFFAPTIGYLLILAILRMTWRCGRSWHQMAVLTASAFAGFWLAGVFALVGVAAAGIGTVFKPSGSKDTDSLLKRIAPLCLAIVLCIAVPFILYGLFTSYRLADSWTMGLPSVFSKSWTTSLRTPYWCLFGLTAVLSTAQPLFEKAVTWNRRLTAVQIALTAAAVVPTCLCWFRDSNFRTELEMSAAVEQYDWQKAADIYSKASVGIIDREKKAYADLKEKLSRAKDEASYERILDRYEDRFFEPTRLMVMYRDLALLKLDKALDTSFSMRDGARPQNAPTDIPLTFIAGPEIYFNYGLVNMAYRWCLENQSQFGWSFHTLRYMAMHAVIMNEPEFADKFLDKLDHTVFFRGWSRKQRLLSADANAMSREMPYCEVTPYMHFEDYLSMDGSKMEVYLMLHFIKDRGAKDSPEFNRAAMLWAMRSKDAGTFWDTFIRYYNSPREDKLPKHVQEAALLYNSIDRTIAGIRFDNQIQDRLASFQEYVRQGESQGGIEPFPAWQKFGDTFFYYYLFQNTEPF